MMLHTYPPRGPVTVARPIHHHDEMVVTESLALIARSLALLADTRHLVRPQMSSARLSAPAEGSAEHPR